ncbi:hypothetical protein Pcac1_g6792 [Phytophthora cactorum]|nr:hypothetical protein Pcac1_g6792 [Phytophthora cactorum]KAG2833571.1 hypothetical protein PC111_g6154 [Phytophthora cactorum]
MSDVQLMVPSESTASRVYAYIRENSPHQVQIQDVYNLIAKIKKSDNNMTDEYQVAALLVEFNMAAEGNAACVKENSRGHEYKFASAPGTMDSYVVEDDELFVTLRRDRRVHKVDKFNWLCSCELSSTVPLPCRHSMLYRKLVCGLFMILFASISAKWLRYGNLNEDLVDVDVPIRISKADTATYLPTRKFEAAIINLEKGCQNLRQGDVTTPNSDSPNGESDIEVPPTQESNAGPTPDGKTDESNEPAIGDADGEEPAAAKPEISPFNPRAKRVGRPKKDKKAENQMRNQDRKEYTRNSK